MEFDEKGKRIKGVKGIPKTLFENQLGAISFRESPAELVNVRARIVEK